MVYEKNGSMHTDVVLNLVTVINIIVVLIWKWWKVPSDNLISEKNSDIVSIHFFYCLSLESYRCSSWLNKFYLEKDKDLLNKKDAIN